MLFADKRALETNLQVSLLKIREKELQFYTQNCIAIGTQVARAARRSPCVRVQGRAARAAAEHVHAAARRRVPIARAHPARAPPPPSET